MGNIKYAERGQDLYYQPFQVPTQLSSYGQCESGLAPDKDFLLVTYCCITNYPKTQGLFAAHGFCGSEI